MGERGEGENRFLQRGLKSQGEGVGQNWKLLEAGFAKGGLVGGGWEFP